MSRRVVLRAAVLVVAAAGILVGLTAYFSSESLPSCLVSGTPSWHPPAGQDVHRFLVVATDDALCFYSIDDAHALVGALRLKGVHGITAVAGRGEQFAVRYDDARGALVNLRTGHVTRDAAPPPAPSGAIRVPAGEIEYSTRPGEFGFRVRRLDTGRVVRVRPTGFTWNPRFGPDPPDHGLALGPDGSTVWVLDAPNSVVHVYRASAGGRPPRHLDDIRLSKPLSGDESPCSHPRCERLGSLLFSADGRYVYVGDAGDVIDAGKREVLANLEALHQSRLLIEMDWIEGRPVFPR
jgi:hypothetical protein